MNQLDRAVQSSTQQLLSSFSQVRNGSAGAIHDARVATRRLRAVLPIAWSHRSPAKQKELERDLRRIGRALGRARAIDVALEILPPAERLLSAARAIAELRADLLDRQCRQRRRVIKRLETFAGAEVLSRWTVDRLVHVEWRTDPRWRGLEAALVEGADHLQAAVMAAGGVYFPNRSHGVRLRTKKLRYLLELVPTSSPHLGRMIKQLRRVQDVLGDVRDRQATADIVADRLTRIDGDTKAEYRALHAWLTADARNLHARYLDHREPLLQVCASVRRDVADKTYRPVTVARALMTVGMAAVPPAAALLSRRLTSSESQDTRVVRSAPQQSAALSDDSEWSAVADMGAVPRR